MKKLIIYSIPNCPWCLKVKRYLSSVHIPFEERNIKANPNFEQECRQISGDAVVPVTVAEDNPREFVFKFDKDKLNKLAQL